MGLAAFAMGGQAVALPTFFPSVSSVKSNERPSEYVRLLTAAGAPRFLISAYDVAASDPAEATAMAAATKAAAAAGQGILLDSGNYEKFWKNDASWTAARFEEVLDSVPASLAFCFDDQDLGADVADIVERTLAAVDRAQERVRHATICPIVHGNPERLETIVRSVAERIQPPLIAVAERELGDGIIARAEMVRRLRSVLDSSAPNSVLHLLGTGSPIAILIYGLAGAQSFDGLEWCRTCVDAATIRLHHFQHRDLVETLSPETTKSLPYTPATLLHNLTFFQTWLARIQEALASGRAAALLEEVLPNSRRDEVMRSLKLP